MTMTIGQVQSLRDSAAEAGDSEHPGTNYLPRVVVKLADTTLDLHEQLQQERARSTKLRRALAWYADRENYKTGVNWGLDGIGSVRSADIEHDDGHLARKILAASGED